MEIQVDYFSFITLTQLLMKRNLCGHFPDMES